MRSWINTNRMMINGRIDKLSNGDQLLIPPSMGIKIAVKTKMAPRLIGICCREKENSLASLRRSPKERKKAIITIMLIAMATNGSENKPLLIDVRTEGEYASGHVPGAINIPHKELEQHLAELSSVKNSQIVLYCRSGTRAGFAKKVLAKNGFTKLDHLTGDYIAWNKKGLPLVKSEVKKAKKVSNPCAL